MISIKRKTESDLTIIKGDKVLTLPYGWALGDAGSFSFRNKLQDRAFTHGSDMVGDGTIDGRTITVEFDVKGATEEEHDEAVNLAYQYFYDTDYQLRAGRADRVYHVAGLSKISHEFRDGFKQRWSKITVSLLLSDPFRYETNECEETFVFGSEATAADMIVQCTGGIKTPVTFKFVPTTSMPVITITHEETGERMQLNDSLLTAPAVMTVNTKDGTVWRNNDNAINTFSGQFLSVVPGTNHFKYSGSPGKVIVTFTNRWFL